jgi:hypothetical protein
VKTREGIILTLRWSKTDQEGQGSELAIPKGRKPATCPVTILRDLAHPGEDQARSRISKGSPERSG